jgi:L-seryl-tRNA(Ser) seleniumtransferase
MGPDDIQNRLRGIPQVEKLLHDDEIAPFIPNLGRSIVIGIIRKVIDEYRSRLSQGREVQANMIVPSIIKNCEIKETQKLKRVINATGVVLHTNLGRAPIGREILNRLSEELGGYCNLEYNLFSEKRGKRGAYAEELAAELSGAEDALIVNNNAAAVLLLLSCFAKGREVIVSRGELVQIGGGFRIPDIMKESGAVLREVGTTNITTLDDYRSAINEDTAMIFSAHRSNFFIEGFSSMPSLLELASLKKNGLILTRDLGSGNLTLDQSIPAGIDPAVFLECAKGPDLLCFSGDKLLGSCQAGIITGRKDLISALRRHPMLRALRLDKLSYFILQEALLIYASERHREIPVWQMMLQDKKDISDRAGRIIRHITHPSKKDAVKKIPVRSSYGGGSMPSQSFESSAIAIEIDGIEPEKIYSAFLSQKTPVVGAVNEGIFHLNCSTVFNEDSSLIAETIDSVLTSFEGI